MSGYDFWNDIVSDLSCTSFAAKLKYNIPDLGNHTSAVVDIPLSCTKDSILLHYSIGTLPDWLAALRIDNSQYFYLDIRVLQPANRNFTKFYMGYTGRDVSYSVLNIARKDYHSPVLPFGAFYKTQIAPFIVKTIENVW